MTPERPRDAGRHHQGLAAEEIAARAYEAEGGQVLATRWRSEAGELDLVIRLGALVVFVEVKARRRAGAEGAVTARQWRRIAAAAELWIGAAPQAGVTGYRFDLAHVDGAGRVTLHRDAVRLDEL